MAFFISLFSKRQTRDNLQQTLSEGFAGQIEAAISTISNYEISPSNEELFNALMANGSNNKEATEIITFLPIAFVRHLLPNVKWQENYDELMPDKRKFERKYSETKAYQIIWAVTDKYFGNLPNPPSIIKIAGRSAEFQAMNKLMLDNNYLQAEAIKLTKTIIVRQ